MLPRHRHVFRAPTFPKLYLMLFFSLVFQLSQRSSSLALRSNDDTIGMHIQCRYVLKLQTLKCFRPPLWILESAQKTGISCECQGQEKSLLQWDEPMLQPALRISISALRSRWKPGDRKGLRPYRGVSPNKPLGAQRARLRLTTEPILPGGRRRRRRRRRRRKHPIPLHPALPPVSLPSPAIVTRPPPILLTAIPAMRFSAAGRAVHSAVRRAGRSGAAGHHGRVGAATRERAGLD
jgi:hypothetical protein